MKIIVFGDVKGQYGVLCKRLSSIITKTGSCEMAFCVGEFFGDKEGYEELLKRDLKFPLQVYVLDVCLHMTDPTQKTDLCTNLTYLGKRGLLKTHSGLSVYYVAGREGDDDDFSHFNYKVLDSTHNITGVDLLLTSQWPQDVHLYAADIQFIFFHEAFREIHLHYQMEVPPLDNGKDYKGSKLISQLATIIKPRYHFTASMDVAYERIPYRNHEVLQEKIQHISRFIALASFNNPHKFKHTYAFNIEAMSKMDRAELNKQPDITTPCPYPTYLTKTEDKPQQFFYQERKRKNPRDNNFSDKRHIREVVVNPDSCWFCLGSVNVQKHMVVAVGTHCYLAMAKGGLTEDHTLIIPINHHPSTTSLPSDALQELHIYKDSLRRLASSQSKVVVFFERSFKSPHLQLQSVPLPSHLSSALRPAIIKAARENNIDLRETPKATQPPEGSFFSCELPDGSCWVAHIQGFFPLHFGRLMLCGETLLNDASRVDWKKCEVSKQKEVTSCQTFRQAFKEFEPPE